MVEENRGEKIDADEFDLDDPKIFEMLSHGDTLGVFQFESDGMTRNLRKLHPDRIEDMIAMNALYRPGPMQFIDKYIERKHNNKKVKYPHPMLKPILEETFGIIVYQEQVMQIARALSGFSFGQADILRRAMGKKKHDVMMAMREDFIQGALDNKIEKKTAIDVFDMMSDFARYGFNKSHSAAYAVVAYQTAFLKTHYRIEFTAANMTNEMDNHDKLSVFIEDARRHNIEVVPVDVGQSFPVFAVRENRIVYALAAVKNVGSSAAEAIVAARDEGGEFENLFDFCERIDLRLVNRRALESLVCAGAFDSINENRAELMASIPEALAWAAKSKNSDIASSAGDLFAGDESLKKYPEPIHSEPWSKLNLLQKEKDALGFYLSGHPLDRFKDEIEAFTNIKLDKIESMGIGSSVEAVGMIISFDKTMTKKNDPMAFGTIEDITGSASIVFFPETFKNYGSLLQKDGLFLFRGKYQVDNGGGKIVADEIIPLDNARDSLMRNVHIRMDVGIASEEIAESIKLFAKHTGKIRLQLHIVGEERTWRAISAENDNDGSSALVSELREIFGKENVWISA
jgi:DNA polymerase-3 subunit alpha